MDQATRCSACNQDQLFGPVHLYSLTTGSLSGDIFAATLPTTGVVRQQTTVPIAVRVCRACGHLDLFATQPEVLFERFAAGER